MRVFVLRRCNVPLLKSVSMTALALVATGCSSGFERFDSAYNSVRPNTVNSQSSTPEGVDNMTTASISRRLVPVADVAPKADPQASYYHNAEPTFARQQAAATTTVTAPVYQQPVVATAPYSAPVSSQPLQPAAQSTYQAPQRLTYTPPAPDPVQAGGSQDVYIPDTTTTASVVNQAPLASASSAKIGSKGWTVQGGTRIVARSGETLYNLSKRYGVPVDSIRKANSMTASDQLKAGQSIIIPSYRYSPTTATSAPDANTSTRAAKASIGFVGEADPKTVPVPNTGPRRYSQASYTTAAVPTVSSTRSVNIPEYRMPKATAPNVDNMTTGSINPDTHKLDSAPARTGITDFRWPVKGRVVAEFGSRTTGGSNEGVDISVPEGTAVRSAENGVVIYAGSGISEYGKLILVQHADDWVSAYAHNRDFEVKKGDRVSRGDIIARSGKSGSADRPKLHFELRKNSVPVNPSKYLASS